MRISDPSASLCSAEKENVEGPAGETTTGADASPVFLMNTSLYCEAVSHQPAYMPSALPAIATLLPASVAIVRVSNDGGTAYVTFIFVPSLQPIAQRSP